MSAVYSYHIFYFPFKWTIKHFENRLFSEQVDLNQIEYSTCSNWLRAPEPSLFEKAGLYNEKNYYYQFVHSLLYDNGNDAFELIRHFERKEPQDSKRDVYYEIETHGRIYRLKVDAININLYATGVGFLSFFLRNEDENQKNPDDILKINQFGRRILPPFYSDIATRYETAKSIHISGLDGDDGCKYRETFGYDLYDYWKPALFIRTLIDELTTNIDIEPIIDDRMFVASWYKNDGLIAKASKNVNAFLHEERSSFWYRYLFVDSGFPTCQNDQMRKELLEKHTYVRWQKWKSLYGVSKYSLVYLTNEGVPEHLLECFQTIYSRMAELVLVQRASMLRFSSEVTKVSNLDNKDADMLSRHVRSLYKEYIRFVNRVYFREVTAQDQGIELYEMLQKCLKMDEYIKDLNDEISELHQYISLIEDRDRNKKASLLNDIATVFLPVTVFTGFWGMNKVSDVFGDSGVWWQIALLVIGVLGALLITYKRKK